MLIRDWLDHGTVGGRSNLSEAVSKVAPEES